MQPAQEQSHPVTTSVTQPDQDSFLQNKSAECSNENPEEAAMYKRGTRTIRTDARTVRTDTRAIRTDVAINFERMSEPFEWIHKPFEQIRNCSNTLSNTLNGFFEAFEPLGMVKR